MHFIRTVSQEVCSNQKLLSLNFKNLRTAVFNKHIYVHVSGNKHYVTEAKEN